VIASIRRFAPRIPFVSALMAATEELTASDDHTVRFLLKRPFPYLPMALAGPGGIACSAVVRHQIGNKLEIEFVDQGEHLVRAGHQADLDQLELLRG
jgi:ABC-type transport system substrate-binding protein